MPRPRKPEPDQVGPEQSQEEPSTQTTEVQLPRFRGSIIPPIDSLFIKALPPVLIVCVVVAVVVNPDGTANVIDGLRTHITAGWTWYFVAYSVLAVALCVWLTFSKLGKVRLGGPKAKPEHSAFAWYSMLFACGQGIGLIFWSLAQPIMMKEDSAILPITGNPGEGGIVWTYFHWGFTAWAIYGGIAACLAYSHHNLGKTLTFREATVDILPKKAQRPAGVVIEMLAIIATVLGLATSFSFAAIQFSSGLSSLTSLESGNTVWLIVIAVFAVLAAFSAFMGVDKGMKRISELNTILSVVLVLGVLLFGPTVYILSNLVQTSGSFISNFLSMSFFTAPELTMTPIDSWQDSWNGWWTVFIWCWVIAFSPFVAGFIARISRGRTIREFVVGVTIVPSIIVMVWVGIIASAGMFYDEKSGGAVTEAVGIDNAAGLFEMLGMIPYIGTILIIVATVLVGTYYVTSLDSGTYALAEFVNAPKKASSAFRVVLVVSIAVVAIVLLSLGSDSVVDTVQTGTIIGAFPFSFVVLLMIINLFRRLRHRDRETRLLEREVNDPEVRPEDFTVDEHGLPLPPEEIPDDIPGLPEKS
ncbi:BCCT family transporter [Dermabacter vaginalis]|uniref:BCCT family transporter n=1 Tax=Dermabacter vaginalis TaxID=1630135 RepID=UPI0021A8DDC0|nr:BCCT family transporter [Dermabacter vaginalis]MCT2149027.1 BCCT family transporter [Dermabacter vaginalis]